MDRRGGSPCLVFLGFTFLTFNSAMAIYRSQDLQFVAFVACSYLDLVLLFICLRWFERAPADSSRRKWLKATVWGLTTLLTAAFSYRVATVMPLPMAVLVCAMAGVALVGIYTAFCTAPPRAQGIDELV